MLPIWDACRPLSSRRKGAFSYHLIMYDKAEKKRIWRVVIFFGMLFCFKLVFFLIRYLWCDVESIFLPLDDKAKKKKVVTFFGILFCFKLVFFSIRYLWCGVESFSKASPYVALSLHNTFSDTFKKAVFHPSFSSPFFFEFEELFLLFFRATMSGGDQPETLWQIRRHSNKLQYTRRAHWTPSQSPPSHSSWPFVFLKFKLQILLVSGPKIYLIIGQIRPIILIRLVWPISKCSFISAVDMKLHLHEVRRISFRSPLSTNNVTNWCSWFQRPRALSSWETIAGYSLIWTARHIRITILFWRYFTDKAKRSIPSSMATFVTP